MGALNLKTFESGEFSHVYNFLSNSDIPLPVIFLQ